MFKKNKIYDSVIHQSLSSSSLLLLPSIISSFSIIFLHFFYLCIKETLIVSMVLCSFDCWIIVLNSYFSFFSSFYLCIKEHWSRKIIQKEDNYSTTIQQLKEQNTMLIKLLEIVCWLAEWSYWSFRSYRPILIILLSFVCLVWI